MRMAALHKSSSLFLPTTAVLSQSSPPTPEQHSCETIAQVQAQVDAENTIPAVSYKLAAAIAGSPPTDSTLKKPLKPALITSTNRSSNNTHTRRSSLNPPLKSILKTRYPDRVTLLCENNKSRQIMYTGSTSICDRDCDRASASHHRLGYNAAAETSFIIDGETLCAHGGLSPEIRMLNSIWSLSRAREIPHEGGSFVCNHVNALSLIARTHQLVQESYKYMFNVQLVTVWSATNYCYRCRNLSGIMTVRDGGERTFEVIEAAVENEWDVSRGMRGGGMAGGMGAGVEGGFAGRRDRSIEMAGVLKANTAP
ncbi:hypothetical protein CVT25_012037 [Psilocybe cyanescens]|uniref:Serine/threonine specific protein phosphatases domain-containing protein n=1 Tax=Psilocybe cyanescens TaxID=93625 RepID=A0A409VWE2_PSICY|nr:hypothetical protein CVT25_012037 [Psilocybe cyanescens]